MRVKTGRYKAKAEWLLALGITVIAALSVLRARSYPSNLGIEQPIPFSHRVHAGKKEIGCLVCHAQAMTAPVAGLPPVETCMLCHSRIIIHHPEIERVRGHYEREEPIWWKRVSMLPDFTRFPHDMHLHAGIDCGVCHGDVAAMDRIVLPQKFLMGFCIECHRRNDASHDCFVCHH